MASLLESESGICLMKMFDDLYVIKACLFHELYFVYVL